MGSEIERKFLVNLDILKHSEDFHGSLANPYSDWSTADLRAPDLT